MNDDISAISAGQIPASSNGDDGGLGHSFRPGDLLECQLVSQSKRHFIVSISHQGLEIKAMLPTTGDTVLRVGDRIIASYVGFYRGQEMVFALNPTIL